MAKWEDYCISKISLTGKTISEAVVHEDFENKIGEPLFRNRTWLVDMVARGYTFCCTTKLQNGWSRCSDFKYLNNKFSWDFSLPEVLTKRKTFLSFYHKDDEPYRIKFEKIFYDLIINKCVNDGDIDIDNSDEYIKKLIQNNHLEDTTVLIVLLSNKTYCRKHVDWEISGALNLKVGEKYSGLLGLLLPTHQDYGSNHEAPVNLPPRLKANIDSDYAILKDWTEDRATLQAYIEQAFLNRQRDDLIVNKGIPQLTKNICD